uniref:BTB domain-containing protein n=1 Tax=Rhizophagus irregularis (strain DAOM 181602 / DAOM 197198 / MUCL 43194) TaxID=747089 RepID=U9UKJ9_RHIID
MSFDYSQEVIRDCEKLLETDEGYDVIIYAGENENVKEIHAFSNLLRIRSKYFRAALSKELIKNCKNEKFIFNFPNISLQFLKIILRFIYCGKVDLTNLQGPDVLKLLIAVDEFKIQTLILCIQEYLTKHQHGFLQQNPIEILETIYQHETFTDLWNYCLKEICTKPDILFKSDKFVNLKAPLLELLLKRDDLSLDEIAIWDSLIKWCFSQHPSIQKDVKKWNKEEIVIMDRTIHGFIPLIRFYNISSADFITKVYPFKKILPKDLVNNILVFHMAPDKQLNIKIQSPRKRKFDSINLHSTEPTIRKKFYFAAVIPRCHYNKDNN